MRDARSSLISLSLTTLVIALVAGGCHRNEQNEDTTANRVTNSADDDADAAEAARRARLAAEAEAAARARAERERACDFGPVYFSYDESELDASAREQLNRNAQCIRTSRPDQVAIIGMTDPRGTTEYNLGLGDRRARAAASFITAQGIPQSTLSIRSAGEEYSAGTSETSWAQDRRADFEAE